MLLKQVDLGQQKNIFVIATIFIVGIGGMTVRLYHIEFSPVACALIAGLLMNLLVNIKHKKKLEKSKEIDQENIDSAEQ